MSSPGSHDPILTDTTETLENISTAFHFLAEALATGNEPLGGMALRSLQDELAVLDEGFWQMLVRDRAATVDAVAEGDEWEAAQKVVASEAPVDG